MREMSTHLHYLPSAREYEYLEICKSAKDTKNERDTLTVAYFFRRIIILTNLSFLFNHYCLVCGQYGDRTHLVLQQGISQMQLVAKA